jgi:hypothetical protein
MNVVEIGETEAVIELYQPELEFIADLLSGVQDGESWKVHWAWTLAAAFRTAAMACVLKDHSGNRLPSPFTWQDYQTTHAQVPRMAADPDTPAPTTDA